MSGWYRMYNSIFRSEKHAQISGDLFRYWVYFSALANEFSSEDAELPPLHTIAFHLGFSRKKSEKVLKMLVENELVDERNGKFFVHEWEQWQYKNGEVPKPRSSSYERVRRFRERYKSVTVTPDVTPDVTLQKPLRNALPRARAFTQKNRSTEEQKERGGVNSRGSEPEKTPPSKSSFPNPNTNNGTGHEPEKPNTAFSEFTEIFTGGIPDQASAVFAGCVNTPELMEAFQANTPLWMKTKRYGDGFEDAVKFIKSGVWKRPPKATTPKQSSIEERAAAWAARKNNT